MKPYLKIVKGNKIVFHNDKKNIEELLLEASPLFINNHDYVIEMCYTNMNIAQFIHRFDIATIIKTKFISPDALKFLQSKRKYVIFEKKETIDNNKSENFERALLLPISEVATLFSH